MTEKQGFKSDAFEAIHSAAEGLYCANGISSQNMHEFDRDCLDDAVSAERIKRNCESEESWRDYREMGRFVSNEAMLAWLDTWGSDEEGNQPTLEVTKNDSRK